MEQKKAKILELSQQVKNNLIRVSKNYTKLFEEARHILC